MAGFFDILNQLVNQNSSNDPNKFMYNQPQSTRFNTQTGQINKYGLSNLIGDAIGGLAGAYGAYNQGAGAGGQWLNLITSGLDSYGKNLEKANNYKGFYDYKKGISDMYPDITPVINGAQSIDQVQKAVDDYNSYLGNYRQIKEPGKISDFEAGKTFKIGSQPSQAPTPQTPILRDKFDPYTNINNYTMNGADDPYLLSHGIRSKEQSNTMIAGGVEKEKMPTPLEMLNNPEYYTKAFEQGVGYNTTINPQARAQQANAISDETLNQINPATGNPYILDAKIADTNYTNTRNKYYPEMIDAMNAYRQGMLGLGNEKQDFIENKENKTQNEKSQNKIFNQEMSEDLSTYTILLQSNKRQAEDFRTKFIKRYGKDPQKIIKVK